MRRLPDLRRFLEAMMAATREETLAEESLSFFLLALFLFLLNASSPFAIAERERKRESHRGRLKEVGFRKPFCRSVT